MRKSIFIALLALTACEKEELPEEVCGIVVKNEYGISIHRANYDFFVPLSEWDQYLNNHPGCIPFKYLKQ